MSLMNKLRLLNWKKNEAKPSEVEEDTSAVNSRTKLCDNTVNKDSRLDDDGLEVGAGLILDGTRVSPSDSESSGSTESIIIEVEHWNNHVEFFFSLLGNSVGLGNVWRFPYICMRNGGGAFLIAYFFALAMVGVPLYYLEVVIGQFSGLRVTQAWSFCPLFEGIGWAMIVVCFVFSVYYSHCITWIIYYFGMSFFPELPWANCNNTWNTPNCGTTNYTAMSTNLSLEQAETDLKPPYLMDDPENRDQPALHMGRNESMAFQKLMSPAEEFWQFHVLELTDDVGTMGGIRWQLVLCHLAAWSFVYLCLIKGIKSLGKAVYVTAIAPYIFLTILIVRGCMLPGASDGIKYYITPQWEKLKDFQIWSEAFLQIFYSVGLCIGPVLTFSSYNRFKSNCHRDALLITVINCLTSFYGGFAIFSIVGFISYRSGIKVENAITSGPGLAFIAYPEGLAQLPFPQLWSVLFFLTLCTLGFGTQFGHMMTVVSGITDRWPQYFKGRSRWILTVHTLIGIIVGLVFCTRGGMYYFQLVDWYGTPFTMVLNCIFEAVAISWIYGLNQIFRDIEMMLGKKPWITYKAFWGVIAPVLMVVFFTYSMTGFVEPTYGDYKYPRWAIGIGWLVALASMLQIPGFAIKNLVMAKGSFRKRLRTVMSPSELWGPQDKGLRAQYKYKTNLGVSNEHYKLKQITTEEC